MTYEYSCEPCENTFLIIKTVAHMDDPEVCPTCSRVANRIPFPRRVHFSKSKVEHAEYNPGLGKVVKNRYHKEELCKRMGVVEVGNDFVSGEKMQATHDKVRAEKNKREWDKL